MLVLHAAAQDETLAIWGEVPFAGPRRRDKPPRCGASADEVRAAVASAGASLTGDARVLTGRLPGWERRPAPSTPLIGEPLAETEMTSWSIETIVVDRGALADVLAFVVGKRLIGPGVLVGADLAFFATAMRLAAALVVRGHVLPSLDESGGDWYARWHPAPIPSERQEIASLYRAIPPVALAFAETADARRAIDGFLASIVDDLMRRSAPRRPVQGATLHDRWIAALRQEDGRIEGSRVELPRLQETIIEWRRLLHEQASADFRVAFRVEEPEADEDRWNIRFLLQGIDDPSLIVPVEHILGRATGGKEAGAARRLFQRSHGGAKRFTLASLAQAASLSSTVDAALRSSTPGGIATDVDEAFRFLASDAPALESAGFGVFLPSWWTRKGAKARLSLRAEVRSPKFRSRSGLSLGELVDVRWRVALGGDPVSLAELRTLADLKAPLVRIRGQWVQLTSDEIREAIRFAKAKGDKHSLGDILRMQLGLVTPEGTSLEVTAVEAEGAAASILERLSGRHEWAELPEPPGFDGTLRPYQARGFSWLDFLATAGLGACLADDMGLGKTVQTLAMLQKQWPDDRAPALLICPTSVTGNWVREAARFTPALPVLLHHGSDRRRGKDFLARAKKSALVVSSYSLLARDTDLLRQVRWKGVILDEAQNVKNSETKQSKAARSVEARFRIALTGTPVENNIGDLWSILDFLNPGYLGSAAKFREKFFIPIQTRRDPEAMEALRRLTAPFLLRRLKTDRSIISDLPEKNEIKVYCTLTKEQASLYQAVVREAETAISGADGISRKGLVLATIMKLKQVCNHPLQLLSDRSGIAGRSGKLARLHEMLGEAVESGDRALIFTQFAQMGGLLQTYLQEQFGLEVFFLHGGTPRVRRDEMVERFQKEGDGPQIFILSLKAGGTGLNLTRANHVFHFDRWWNPAVENQATDRAFRIGQTRSVQVHKFICGGTFEEKIDAMIEGKLELATRIVGTGEGWLTELSDRDLRELFALRADAVAE